MMHTRLTLALAVVAGLSLVLLARAQNPVKVTKPSGGVIAKQVVVGSPGGGSTTPQTAQAPTSQPKPKDAAVVCAVFYQPSNKFAMEKARGITAVYGYDYGANNSMDAWCTAAQQAGLKYYLQCFKTVTPGACAPVMPLTVDPVAMAHQNDANLLGYVMPDEPNGVGQLTGEQCQALYAACKAAAPKVPVVLNLDGGHVMQFGQAGTTPYLLACDIVCFDHYPENYGSRDIPNLKVIAKDLKTWSGGKPVMEIFECCDMDIKIQAWCAGTPLAKKMTGPTAAQMKAEVASGHAGGVDAICWFQDRIGIGFQSYDGTDADEQAAMLQIDTDLQTGKW